MVGVWLQAFMQMVAIVVGCLMMQHVYEDRFSLYTESSGKEFVSPDNSEQDDDDLELNLRPMQQRLANASENSAVKELGR